MTDHLGGWNTYLPIGLKSTIPEIWTLNHFLKHALDRWRKTHQQQPNRQTNAPNNGQKENWVVYPDIVLLSSSGFCFCKRPSKVVSKTSKLCRFVRFLMGWSSVKSQLSHLERLWMRPKKKTQDSCKMMSKRRRDFKNRKNVISEKHQLILVSPGVIYLRPFAKKRIIRKPWNVMFLEVFVFGRDASNVL